MSRMPVTNVRVVTQSGQEVSAFFQPRTQEVCLSGLRSFNNIILFGQEALAVRDLLNIIYPPDEPRHVMEE